MRETSIPLGSIAVGVAVRHGSDAPNLCSPDTVRAALRRADPVIYNRASSGTYIETMIETLGLSNELAERTVRPETGRAVMEELVSAVSSRALAFGQVTEIKRLEHLGLRLVGPLPDGLANKTAYGAARTRTSRPPAGAKRLMQFLQSAEARSLLKQSGLE